MSEGRFVESVTIDQDDNKTVFSYDSEESVIENKIPNWILNVAVFFGVLMMVLLVAAVYWIFFGEYDRSDYASGRGYGRSCLLPFAKL